MMNDDDSSMERPVDVFHDEQDEHSDDNHGEVDLVHRHVFQTYDGFSIGDVSNMTDDASSVGSSRVSISSHKMISSVFKQSIALLQGQIPEEGEETEVELMSARSSHSMGVGSSPVVARTTQFAIPETVEHDSNRDFPDNNNNSRQPLEAMGQPLSRRDSSSRIDFLQDHRTNMTYARRLALHLMSRKAWYNPQLEKKVAESTSTTTKHVPSQALSNVLEVNEEDAEFGRVKGFVPEMPSLEKAWAYFEHVTLPRHIVYPKDEGGRERKSVGRRIVRKLFAKGDQKLDRAEPGECYVPSKLYSPIFTPLKQMGDFGLGIGLYFTTLRALTILTLLAGLVNIPNFIYFQSDEYSDSQPGVRSFLKGSAICTNTVWVPCPDCNPEDFKQSQNRLAQTNSSETGDPLYFALQNDCDGTKIAQGMVSYATLFTIIIGIFVLNIWTKKKEIEFDEDEQTAQDYSIVITNPPSDARDPEEWRAFFREKLNAQITCCTVAVDNDLMVRCLVERRERFRQLEMMLPQGTSLDVLNLARIAAKVDLGRNSLTYMLASIVPGVPEIFGRIVVLNAKIQGLAQQRKYPVTNVFVTFETEEAQRRVLHGLSVGSMHAWRNQSHTLASPEYLFRGNLVLNVHEAEEPSTVRWTDLNEKIKDKVKQLVVTMFLTCAIIALVAFIVKLCRDKSAFFAAMAISISNALFPLFAKLLTSIESHASESGKQASLYVKIAVFRWVNTAIVITIITPFTYTLGNDGDSLIPSIYAIFFAEMVTTNVIQLADPAGHLKRHILAPRAPTQDLMNLQMGGTIYELAERYTSMTKILFLALWYSAVFPATLFLCSLTLFINYFADRFSLMRTWRPAPQLGTTISQFSRKYFFSTSIVAMAVVSSYAFSGFPYDNICMNDGSVSDEYIATWNVQTIDGESNHTVTVSSGDESWRFCSQDMLRNQGQSFPALPRFQPDGGEWMTNDQETVTNIYGWTSLAVLVLVVLKLIFGVFLMALNLFRSTYKPSGKDQGVNFSEQPSISCYIPQVMSDVFSYPLLACDVQGLDEELFDWEDPDKLFSFYDLTHDAEELLASIHITKEDMQDVFSRISHWPPTVEQQHVEEASTKNGGCH